MDTGQVPTPPQMKRYMISCCKPSALLLWSVSRLLALKDTPQASQMQRFSFIVASLDNRVVGRSLQPSHISGNVLEKKSARHTVAPKDGWAPKAAGPIRRASFSMPPGMDSDPELISLYIIWCLWKWCLKESFHPYTIPQIISQAEWPYWCNLTRPIWLAGLCSNHSTIVLIHSSNGTISGLYSCHPQNVLTMCLPVCPEPICIVNGVLTNFVTNCVLLCEL